MKKWIMILILIHMFLLKAVDTPKAVDSPKGLEPSNLTIQYVNSNVTLEWDSIPTVDMYYIYSKDNPYGISNLLDSTTNNQWSGVYNENKSFFVITSKIPNLMVFIEGGTFQMGTHFAEGHADELPVHNVTISDFYMGKYEVTQKEWLQYMPGRTYNYGAGDNYPVYYVKWYQLIVYCNLRSIDEGLNPCYTISGSTDPADWGEIPTGQDGSDETWDSVICDFNTNGYRLPTEAEWEYAARGGLIGQRFPNGLTISHGTNGDTQANYDSYWVDGTLFFSYDVSLTEGTHPDYGYNSSPVGSFPPNGYGLYDMSGNPHEWCWDWHDSNYYTTCNDQGIVTDPTGPDTVSTRVRRGGGWHDSAFYTRVADRVFGGYYADHVGFRVVRSEK